MSKNPTITTPAGKLLYPRITTPDTKFDPEGVYSVQIVLEPGAEREKVGKVIHEVRDKAIADARAEQEKKGKAGSIKRAELPVKQEMDSAGTPTGNLILHAKLKAKGKNGDEVWDQRPAIFDAKGTAIPPKSINPWSGTIGKLSVEVCPFYTGLVGAGVTLRLRAVQIIELVSGGERDASSYGFEEEDGWEAEADEAAAVSGQFPGDAEDAPVNENAPADVDEDDLPF